ncbi:MAG: hypothetical protein JWN31_559 [Frankiales bacterium]|nr:hypothetical protein [Frankiales bacterium]
MSRLTKSGLLAAAGLLAAGLSASAPAGAAVPAATFSPPLLLGGGGAEPSIRVPSDGKSTAYISAPSGVGSNFWRITEKTNPDKSITFLQSPVQQPDLGTGGGDSEISVGDPATPGGCGTIAYSGLHNIDTFGNFTTAQSTDCGESFSLANPVATQNTLSDRQWQAFDGKKTNFLMFHKVDTSQIVVTQSSDGGQHYLSLHPDSVRGVIDAATLPSVVNANQVGNLVVDQNRPTGTNNLLSGEPTHRMYAVFGGPRDPADNVAAQQDTVPGVGTYNHIDTIYVGVSDDGGLTWTDHKVFSVDPASKRELNMLFPVVDVDRAGNVYVVWSDTFRVEYAVSTDGGQTFGPAHLVNHDKLDGTRANLFPWLAAGANGMLDLVWYHGEGGGKGSALSYRDPGTAKTTWTVAFAQLGKANTAAPQQLSYSEAVTPAIHKGDICLNGTFCDVLGGDRSLLDFFEVAIDKNGRANLAFADNAGAPGALQSSYSRQLSGYSLVTGKPLPVQRIAAAALRCSSDAAFTDPAGDATDFVVSTPLPSQPALDITRGSVSFDKQLVLHTKLLDLSQDPPVASTGEEVEFSFAYAGIGYTAVGSHDSGTGDEFHMESPLRTTVGGSLTGTFDKAKSEVRINVPADFFSKLGKGPVLAKGAQLTGLAITTRREAGVIVPNADAAGSLGCPFVVGAQAATGPQRRPVTVPAKVDHRRPPVLAATGLPLGLPLIGAGVVLGAAVLLRRRKTA